MNDGYFIAAVMSCASCQDGSLVSDMIVDVGADVGLYAVKFFVNGMWVTVVVDDQFPCTWENNYWQPVFVRSAEDTHANCRSLWMQILEKAWAKLHGSYESISSGTAEDALNYLTGGFTDSMHVKDSSEQDEWRRLSTWTSASRDEDRRSFCSCTLREEITSNAALLAKCSGAVPGHTFSVVGTMLSREGHKLIQLWDPWGSFVWKGSFCSSDPQWTTSLKAQGGYTEERGVFWMIWADFLQYFEQVGFCNPWTTLSKTDDDEIQHKHVTTRGCLVAGQSAGGRLGQKTFKHNPRFTFSSATSTAYLSVFQRDCRCLLHDEWLDLYVYLFDPESDDSESFCPVQIAELTGRQRCVEIQVEPGKRYVLIVSAWEPGVEADFWISAACTRGATTLKTLPALAIDEQDRSVMRHSLPRARFQQLAWSSGNRHEADDSQAQLAQLKAQIVQTHSILGVFHERMLRNQQAQLTKLMKRLRTRSAAEHFSSWVQVWQRRIMYRMILIQSLDHRENRIQRHHFQLWSEATRIRIISTRADTYVEQARFVDAFKSWTVYARRSARSRVVQQRIVSKTRHHSKAKLFDGWCKLVMIQRTRRVVVERALTRMRQVAVAGAFARWVEMRQDIVIARRVLMRLQSMRLSMSLSRWVDAVDMWKIERDQEAHEAELLATKAELYAQQARAAEGLLQRWKMQGVAKCWSSWVGVVDLKHRLRKALLCLTVGNLSSAFSGWVESASEIRRHRLILQRVLVRMQQMQLSSAWVAWFEFAKFSSRSRTIVVRLVTRWRMQCMSMAFEWWQSWINKKEYQKNTLAKAVRRFGLGCVLSAFDGWRESIVMLRSHHAVVKRVLLRMQHSTVLCAFGEWWEYATTSKQHKSVVERVLLRVQQMALSGAFGSWCDTIQLGLRSKALLARAVIRRRFMSVSAAYDMWFTWATVKLHQRSILMKLIIRISRSRMSNTFGAWFTYIIVLQERRALAQRVLLRLQRTAVYSIFNRWVDAMVMKKSRAEKSEHHMLETQLLMTKMELHAQQARAAESLLQRWRM
eukprot:SAG11_NODE_1305_length_5246_cov_7.559161_1_plen_1036_part_10